MKVSLLILTLLTLLFSNDSSFYFIQISDTHWGKSGSLETTEKVVEMINALPFEISCVVHTGDVANWDSENETVDSGVEILNKLKMPIHFVPGNTDITNKKDISHFTSLIGPQPTSVEYDDLTFALINSEPLRTGKEIVGYDPIMSLNHVLKKSKQKPVIVAHHAPSVGDFYNNEMHHWWSDSSSIAWKRSLNSGTVIAVIAGHFHRDEHHWLGEVPLFVCASIDSSWGRQSTCRLFEFKDEKLSYRTLYLK